MWPILMSIEQLVKLLFFFCRCRFVMQCAFESPVKMTANESEICVFVSNCVCVYAVCQCISRKESTTQWHSNISFGAKFHWQSNMNKREKKPEKRKTKRKNIRSIENMRMIIIMCFMPFSVWILMGSICEVKNAFSDTNDKQIRKETYPFKPITLLNYASFRPSFLSLFCADLIDNVRWIMWWTWTRPFIAGQKKKRRKSIAISLATFYYFIETLKRQLKSLLGFWFSDRNPFENDMAVWNWPHSIWFLLQFNEQYKFLDPS